MENDENTRDGERMALVEAALYAAGRPLELDELTKMAETRSEKVALRLIAALARRFDDEKSALEVKELPDNRFVLQLRLGYTEKVRRVANRPLLSRGPLKTLSYIAYYQPVEQGKVLEDRGKHIYSHLKMLESMGLISREKMNSRETVIRTTSYFADYFGFSHNASNLKVQLRRLFEQMKIEKIEDLKENGLSNTLTLEPSPSGNGALGGGEPWGNPDDKPEPH
jgi:segregation and condensation protein B